MRIVSVILFVTMFFLFGCSNNETADKIFSNGKIYTVDENNPWAEAIAVKNGSIIAVGTNNEIEKLKGDKTEEIDLGGNFVMPGIITTHDHATAFMPFKAGLVMPNNGDPKWMLDQLQKYIKENPEGPFYSFGGAFEGSVMITREEIDAIISDKPFLMIGQGGHGGWANSKALEMSGVVKGKPDPIDSYGRHADGTPTGEITASPGVFWIVKELNLVKKESILESAPPVMQNLNSKGIVASNEVMTFPGTEEAIFSAMAELEKGDKLTVRFTMCTAIQRPVHINNAIENLKKYGSMYSSEYFNVNTLKIHGDGAFENRTAALIDHYPDQPNNFGFLALPQDQVIDVMLETAKNGFNIHTHTIGNKATNWALNGFEEVRNAGYKDVRLTTGHTMLVNEEDKIRFADLNISVNTLSPEVRPTQAAKLALTKDLYEKMMPVGSFLNLGVRVGASADFPVFDVNPFPHMYTMMMRRNKGSEESLPSVDEQITLEQAVRTYTIDAAYIINSEKYLGSLVKGKRADLIILDRNIFDVSPEEMADTKVLKTIVNGKIVFDRSEELKKQDLVSIEVTNPALKNAIDVAKLNLLVEEEEMIGFSVCDTDGTHEGNMHYGSQFAPNKVNNAFSALAKMGYFFVRPARSIYWEKDDQNYWIQWTKKDAIYILWAFDPISESAVEILQVIDRN